jgi:hypothetical protein
MELEVMHRYGELTIATGPVWEKRKYCVSTYIILTTKTTTKTAQPS